MVRWLLPLSRARSRAASRRAREATRDVEPAHALDLLTGGRCCLAYPVDQTIACVPLAAVRRGEAYELRWPPAERTPLPEDGAEAVLLADRGTLLFDLRALYVRGSVSRDAGLGAGAPTTVRLVPRRSVAWDYGKLRWARDAD